MPQSTVRIPTPEASMGPMVDPHPISFLTTKSCANWKARTLYVHEILKLLKKASNQSLTGHKLFLMWTKTWFKDCKN